MDEQVPLLPQIGAPGKSEPSGVYPQFTSLMKAMETAITQPLELNFSAITEARCHYEFQKNMLLSEAITRQIGIGWKIEDLKDRLRFRTFENVETWSLDGVDIIEFHNADCQPLQKGIDLIVNGQFTLELRYKFLAPDRSANVEQSAASP